MTRDEQWAAEDAAEDAAGRWSLAEIRRRFERRLVAGDEPRGAIPDLIAIEAASTGVLSMVLATLAINAGHGLARVEEQIERTIRRRTGAPARL